MSVPAPLIIGIIEDGDWINTRKLLCAKPQLAETYVSLREGHIVPLLLLCFADEETTLLVIRLNRASATFRCSANGDYALHAAARSSGSLNISLNVFAALVDAAPDTLFERNNDGDLPIHCAIRNGGGTHILRFLVSKYPESTTLPDAEGYLPIHLGALFQSTNSKDVLSFLLGADIFSCSKQLVNDGERDEASAAQICGGFNRVLPLHLACQTQSDLDVIKLILDAYPEAASMCDKNNCSPLGYAIRYNDSAEALKFVLSFMRTGQLFDEIFNGIERKNALHVAVLRKAPLEILECICDFCVQEDTNRMHLARLEDASGQIPIEYAIESNFPADNLKVLLMAHPEGLLHKNPVTGNTPIMSALEDTLPEKHISVMLNALPSCCKLRNNDMKLPIHFVCWKARKFSQTLLLEILNAYPGGAEQQETKYGYYPLSYAVQYGAPIVVVEAIIKAYPSATRLKNNNGALPLHLAVQNQASFEVVKALLNVNPAAPTTVDSRGMLPLAYALDNGASAEVIKLLMQSGGTPGFNSSFSRTGSSDQPFGTADIMKRDAFDVNERTKTLSEQSQKFPMKFRVEDISPPVADTTEDREISSLEKNENDEISAGAGAGAGGGGMGLKAVVAALQHQVRSQQAQIRDLNSQIKFVTVAREDKELRLRLERELEEVNKERNMYREKANQLETTVIDLNSVMQSLRAKLESTTLLQKFQNELEETKDALHARDRKLKELRDDIIMKDEEMNSQHSEIVRLKKLVSAYVDHGKVRDKELEHTQMEMERLSEELDALKHRHAVFVMNEQETRLLETSTDNRKS